MIKSEQTITRRSLDPNDCYSHFSHLPHYIEDTVNFHINHGLRTHTLGYQCPPSAKTFTIMDQKSAVGAQILCMDARRLTEVSNNPSCGATARAQAYLVALETQFMTVMNSILENVMAACGIEFVLPSEYTQTTEKMHESIQQKARGATVGKFVQSDIQNISGDSVNSLNSSTSLQSSPSLTVFSSKHRVQSTIMNSNPVRSKGLFPPMLGTSCEFEEMTTKVRPSPIYNHTASVDNVSAGFSSVGSGNSSKKKLPLMTNGKVIPVDDKDVFANSNESSRASLYIEYKNEDFCESWRYSIRNLLLKQVSLVLGLVVSSQPYIPVPIVNLTHIIEKFINTTLFDLLGNGSLETAKDAIDKLVYFIRQLAIDKIIKPTHKISNIAASWIKPGDVIVTFGNSHLVTRSLIYAHMLCQEHGYDPIEVCVLDSSCPKQSALGMVKTLSEVGINCSYGLITAVNFFMKRATKVFTGAFEVNGDGSIVARAGTNIICEMAHRLGKPVIVLAEMFKFSANISTETSLYNCISQIEGVDPSIKTVCPMFDITPASRVSVIVSECENIAPGSVSAVVAEMD